MEAFLSSLTTVAIAEIGDKTQLLSLLLTVRFKNNLAIVAGILFATLLNHAFSAWAGIWLSA
ncbi:MAG: TMEM165/GDT1 family protein, partial [Pseudomonadota bacterium]|nr:TMEM165/GDT1 family protein [Pseudomonadota bacterium]